MLTNVGSGSSAASPAAIPAPGVAGPESRARKRIGSAKAAAAQDRLIALVERGIAAVVVEALLGIGRAPASAAPRRLAPLRARPALGVSVGEQQSHYCDTEQNKTDCAHGSSPSPSLSCRQCKRRGRVAAEQANELAPLHLDDPKPKDYAEYSRSKPCIAAKARRRITALQPESGSHPRSCHVSGRGDICTATKTVAIRSLRRPPFAERDTLWILCRSVRQSGLAPKNFTTLAHFSILKRIEIARG